MTELFFQSSQSQVAVRSSAISHACKDGSVLSFQKFQIWFLKFVLRQLNLVIECDPLDVQVFIASSFLGLDFGINSKLLWGKMN